MDGPAREWPVREVVSRDRTRATVNTPGPGVMPGPGFARSPRTFESSYPWRRGRSNIELAGAWFSNTTWIGSPINFVPAD